MKNMIGKNNLHLCYAEMFEAMQLYLDQRMPDAGVTVISVNHNESENEFIISFTDKDE